MSRATKLFQRAGSPLIQGESRTRGPWWKPFMIGVVCGVATPFVVSWIARLWLGEPMPSATSDVVAEWSNRAMGLVVGAVGGAAVGTSVGRSWGAVRPWMPSTLLSVGAGYGLALIAGMIFG